MNSGKRYNTSYKKNVPTERDVYLFRRSPKGILTCRGCGAIYYLRRWTLQPPAEVRSLVATGKGVGLTFCPACQKMRDHFWLGVVEISGTSAKENREVVRLIKNEEARAREKNPLERIMRIAGENGGLRVETTTEKLAQRLGRSLGKAMGGKVTYKWSHRNKFARVLWEKSSPKTRSGGKRAR